MVLDENPMSIFGYFIFENNTKFNNFFVLVRFQFYLVKILNNLD